MMKKNGFRRFLSELFTPRMIIALLVLILVIGMAIFAPFITPYDVDEVDLVNMLQPPNAQHLLGTDAVGRDQFTRVLYGGRTSLINALLVVLLAMFVGIPMGLVCGYKGGLIDRIWMTVCDFLLAFPVLLLAFVLVVALGRGGHIAVIALAIVYIPSISKLARSLILTEKTKGYVEACKSVCFSDVRIIFSHILPNCIPTMVAEITLDFGYAIIGLTSLSFLGLGVQAPKADWGCMLSDGMAYIFRFPMLSLAPAICIVIVSIALNVLSDGIMMYIDPDQRKVPSFKQYEKKMRKKGANYGGEHS